MSNDENNGSAPTPGQSVPWDRFSQVNERMKAAETKVAELSKMASSVSAYQAEMASLQEQLSQSKAQMGTTNTLLGAGIYDAEQRELAQYCYGKLPQDGRPPLGDYLSQQQADPQGLMKHVWGQTSAPSVPQVAPQTSPPSQATSQAEPTPPVAQETPQPLPQRVNPNQGAITTERPPSGAISNDYIKSLSTEQYRSQRDQILASLGKRSTN